MTPEQIELVEHSLEQARPRLADLVDDFYVRLFASDPEVADLFTTDPAVQRARFAAELETIAATIRRHDRSCSKCAASVPGTSSHGVRAATIAWRVRRSSARSRPRSATHGPTMSARVAACLQPHRGDDDGGRGGGSLTRLGTSYAASAAASSVRLVTPSFT